MVKFIDRGPHCYTRRVKEAIHIRLHPNNINRDNGVEIPEAWMPTITQHSRSVPQRTSDETGSYQNNEERNSPITNNQGTTYIDTEPVDIVAWCSLVPRCSLLLRSPREV